MPNNADLQEIVEYLNNELNIHEIPDYSAALNGLQLQNSGKVTKVGAAVDASLPVIRKAVDDGIDFLIVHHGMFWHGAQRLVKAQYEKIKVAMDADLAIYSAHIPLDIHLKYGNNALLANEIGMADPQLYHDWKGVKLGLKQTMACDFNELKERLTSAVGGEIHFCKGRDSADVGMVGIITGGAGSEIQVMADAGIDTFITGEGPHWSYPLAEELGVNIFYAGHYATEIFGVSKIVDVISHKYSIDSGFVDHPTGL